MSPSQPSANSNVSADLTKSMHDHWGLYLGEGVVLILLGLAAIIFPFIAGIVATVFLGFFHASSDSQNKLLAMPLASTDSNHGKNISWNQRSVWVLNLGDIR